MDFENNYNPRDYLSMNYNPSPIPQSMIDNISKQSALIEKRSKLQEKANQATIDNQAILQQIAKNTAYLEQIVEINRQTQLNTEELTYIERAIYGVSVAKNKKEADNLFKEALAKINESGETAGNITNLISLLNGIYNTVIMLLQNNS